jgi:predicted  nucleic acid-binding Zn-ribbon protein
VMENESLRSQLECASGEDKVLQDQIGRLLEDRVWPLEKENENLIEQLERTTMELEEQKRYFEIEIERIMRESMEELFSYHEKLDGAKGDLFSANEKLEEVKKQT